MADQEVQIKVQEFGVDEKGLCSDVGSHFFNGLWELIGIFILVTCVYWTGGDVNKFIWGFWIVLTFFGNYSGAYVNPAISFGFYIYEGNFINGITKLVFYWIGQTLGAFLAVKVGHLMTHTRVYVVVPDTSLFEIVFSEFLFTGTFLFVILSICSKHTQLQETNPAINCGVIAGWFFCAVKMGAPLSGAAYNPSILLALNSHERWLGNEKALTFVWEMIIAEFLGVAIFALLFKYIYEKSHVNFGKAS